MTFNNNFNNELGQSDIYREHETTINDCIYSNDASLLDNYIPTSYSEPGEDASGSRNYTVSTYKLSGNVVNGKTFADIQNAIDNAKGGDVIELSGTYIGSGKPISVTKSITIVGVGQAILDAEGLSTIFEIKTGGVSIFNLRLTNGYSSLDDFYSKVFAGAINSYNNNLYVGNTIFEKNNGYLVGGIYSSGSRTILNNCTFRENKVGFDKQMSISLINYDSDGDRYDVVYSYKSTLGGAYLTGKNSVMDYCVFRDNEAYKNSAISGSDSQVYGPVVKLSVPSFIKYYGDSKKLLMTLTEDGKCVNNAKISVQIGKSKSSTVYTDSNGKASVDLNDLLIGTYMVVSKYNDVLLVSVVVVDNYNSHVEIKTSDVVGYYGGTQKIVTQLTEDNVALSNVDVKITVNGKTSTVKTDSKGQASVSLNLPVGTYDVVSEYDRVSATSKITVKSTVGINDATGNYSNAKVSAAFLDTSGKALASKSVTFKVGSKTYTATTNGNGIATANVDLGVGTYTVTAINPVNNEQKSGKLTISKASSSIVLTANQNINGVTLTASLTPSTATGKVLFAVIPTVDYGGMVSYLAENRKDYQSNIVNGKATVNIPDLAAGSYSAFVIYEGDDNVGSFESDFTDFNVAEVYPILTAGDLTKTYGTSNKLAIKLVDSKGNAIANAAVNVVLAGWITPAVTDSNGNAYATVNLAPGAYVATVTSGDLETTAKVVVKKATPKITAAKKTYKASVKTKKYTVTLKVNGKAMKSTKVSLKVNKKTYTVKTNSKGQATFKITNLKKKGTFSATLTYKATKYYNKATKTVKITVKK